MLCGLSRWLRVLDVDTACEPLLEDAELVRRAVAEGRTILSRDRKLLERRLTHPQLFIRDDDVRGQLRQVVLSSVYASIASGSSGRCLRCNCALVALAADSARPLVPPYVARTVDEFRQGPACGRIYWHGTHVGRMEEWLERSGSYPRSPSRSV
jgi:uncharacterized protein